MVREQTAQVDAESGLWDLVKPFWIYLLRLVEMGKGRSEARDGEILEERGKKIQEMEELVNKQY